MTEPASPPDSPTAPAAGPADASAQALAAALRQLLAPLAQLAVARGVPHAVLDELLKQALVQAADAEHAALPAHRRVSRIATTTGIHRREVSRLVDALHAGAASQPPARRSHASELFTHWRSQPAYAGPDGQPLVLPRQGPAPSFESLAQAITRDVHPRSLLDELLRLGLAAHDAEADSVRLLSQGFVPQNDEARLLGVLGRNVAAHLSGAVENLLAPGDDRGHRHFEQAIFAGGLGPQSLEAFRGLVQAQWQALLKAMVPALEQLVEQDAAETAQAQAAAQPTPPRHQVRLGLYSHARADGPAAAAAAARPAAPTTRRARRGGQGETR